MWEEQRKSKLVVLSAASRMRLEDYFLLFVIQNEEENEINLPFFNQLSHLGAAMIVMTRVLGKGVVWTICERKRHRVRGLLICLFVYWPSKNKRKWL